MLLSAAADVATARGDSLSSGDLVAAADRTLAWLVRRETPTAAMLRAHWLPLAHAAAPDDRSWDAAWAAGENLPLQQALILAANAVASTATHRQWRVRHRALNPIGLRQDTLLMSRRRLHDK